MKRTEKANIHLLALISNNALAGDQLPAELKLFDSGINQTRKVPVTIGERTRAMLPRLQRERGFDRVALDFEHNTVPGSMANKESTEPRPVAAFGIPDLRADGLYLRDLIWTPEGKKSARNFCDLSPAPELDANGEVIFLHSAALVRQGAVDGLSFFSVELPTTNTSEDQLMDKILSALRKGLGLAETATEEDIQKSLLALSADMAQSAKSMELITSLNAKLADFEAKIVTLSAPGAKPSAPGALPPELTTLSAKIEEINGKVITFAAEIEKRDRGEIVAQACREGKVIPLSVEQVNVTPVATLRDMVAKLAVTVPVEQRTPVKVQEFSVSGDMALSEQDKKIAAKLGFSEEDVKKANNIK